MAKELVAALKAVIKKQVEAHNDLSKAYKKSKNANHKEQLQESAELIRSRKATLQELDTSCIKGELKIIIEAPFEDLMLVSELDHVYEEVIEQGIKMSTGPNPDIAASYKEAMDYFVELYDKTSDGLKQKWQQAKKEVDKNAAILKEKMGKAADTIEGFKNQMRGTGIRGYFRYAEGVINAELIRRLDWVMSSTGAFVSDLNGDGNAGQDGEIIIENYELTGDAQGELVYTHKGKVTKLTSRIFELASMLSAPFYKDEQSHDMKPGTGQAFCGNQAGSDKNSSVMLRTAAKPQPDVVEIPDWTDGKIQELIDTYNRRCAAGMPNREARNRKTAMLKEIEVHQGALIEELYTIHDEQGERKDTAILLSIWRKKKEMWENEANSLGAGCVKPTSPSGTPVNVQDLVNKFISFCTRGLLPDSAASYLIDEIQKLLDQEQAEIDRIEKEKADYIALYDPRDLDEPAIKDNIQRYDDQLTILNESHTENLKGKKRVDVSAASGNCYTPIELDVKFKTDENKIKDVAALRLNLANVVNVMTEFPTTKVTIIGYHGGGLTASVKDNIETEDIPTYDSRTTDSVGGTKHVTGDVAMLRAESIKKELVSLGVTATNIECQAGAANKSRAATLTLK